MKRRTRKHSIRTLFIYCGRGKWRKLAIDGYPAEGIPSAEDRQILYERIQNPRRGDRACIIETEVPEEEEDEEEKQRLCRVTTIIRQKVEPSGDNNQSKTITEFVYTDKHGGMWINKEANCAEPEPTPDRQELIERETNDPKKCDRVVLIEEVIRSTSCGERVENVKTENKTGLYYKVIVDDKVRLYNYIKKRKL